MMLPYTLDEVRDRELHYVGTKGRPNPWFPGGYVDSDCVAYQTDRLGLRKGNESIGYLVEHDYLIGIAAFRMEYRWPMIARTDLQPGDLICENWTGRHVDGVLEAEHMEWVYSIDHSAQTVVIVAANTGPEPGVALPNGCWKKRRPLDEHILFGLRPPYAPSKPPRARRAEVVIVARFLNSHVPAGLFPTDAEKDGIAGARYWRLVQTYGRTHGWYPHQYVIDGVPGPQSRKVEAAIYQVARAGK